jgi:hypothetical protein
VPSKTISVPPHRCPVFGDFTQTHVHRLDGVGGVNNAPDSGGQSKNGTMRAQLRRQDWMMVEKPYPIYPQIHPA